MYANLRIFSYFCHTISKRKILEKKSLNLKRTLTVMCLLFIGVFTSFSADKPFVVVLDAGHGGKDAGAIGYTLKKLEKDINLKVAIKVGDQLAKEKNVKVLYTRKKDIFIPLDDRAQIANKAKADLFISIHTNAAENRSAKGTESYAVGSSSANLAVAKRENAVLLYESDYKTKYRGFDPNSTESYIMFDFLQSKFQEQSIGFASAVEKNFVKEGRSSRGVKQAGFWVLKQAAMPAVLVELGYISNREEEEFLSKDKNLDKLANAIVRAFIQYKKSHDKRNSDGYSDSESAKSSNNTSVTPKVEEKSDAKENVKEPAKESIKESAKESSSADSAEKNQPAKSDSLETSQSEKKDATVVEKKESTEKPSSEKTAEKTVEKTKAEEKKPQIYYAVQFCSASAPKSLNAKEFQGLVPAQEFVETGTYKYKYVYGHETTFDAGVKLRDEVKKKFKDAFLVVIKDGKKLSTQEAREYYK